MEENKFLNIYLKISFLRNFFINILLIEYANTTKLKKMKYYKK